MKNFEKFETEIMEIASCGSSVAVVKGVPQHCNKTDCKDCDFHGCKKCMHRRYQWFYEEYKERPKLNKYERALCEALQKGWIARDKADDFWYLYDNKPKKYEYVWKSIGRTITQQIRMVSASPEIKFDFIKWEDEEPWSIEDLLKLEVEE